MDNLQEIEGLEGLHRIEKIKLYKKIIPLENSFIVKDETKIEVVRNDERAKGKM